MDEKDINPIVKNLISAIEHSDENEIVRLISQIKEKEDQDSSKKIITKKAAKFIDLNQVDLDSFSEEKAGIIGFQNYLWFVLRLLRLKGLTQTKVGEFYDWHFENDISISQPVLSKAINNDLEDSEQVRLLIECTSAIYEAVNRDLGLLKSFKNRNNVKQSKPSINDSRLKTWSAIVEEFVTDQIDFYSKDNSMDGLCIEAIGMKLGSLSRVLKNYLSHNKLPKCKLKLIIIDPDDTGLFYRNKMEFTNNAYTNDIKTGFLHWKEFKNRLESKGGIKDTELNIRFLKPDPNFYMIKIHDQMLTSVYLRDPGNTTHSARFSREDNPKEFQDYYNAYLRYYECDDLSSDCDWNNDIFDESVPLKLNATV